MPVDSLQHVNIRCADAAKSRDFYVEILGLVDGHRPAFQSVGYWLYLGDVPAIHLVQQTAAVAQSGGERSITWRFAVWIWRRRERGYTVAP